MKGKNIALITGAGRGIGLAITRRLNPAYRLILVTKTPRSASRLRKEFPQAAVYAVDLTQQKELSYLVRQVKKALTRLDVLVNNAGIYYAGRLEKTTPYELETMCRLHLEAPFLLIRGLLPLLRRSKQKQVINISSAASFARLPTESAYTATKAGLTALSDVLQLELQPDGIRLSAIHPWSVNTKNLPGSKDWLQPEDIAEIVEFILSRRKNCQILNVETSGLKDWRGAWPPF